MGPRPSHTRYGSHLRSGSRWDCLYFARRVREATLTPAQASALFALFQQDRTGCETIELTSAIAQDAAALLLTAPPMAPLRTLDAFHIVSAQRAFAATRGRGIAIGSLITAGRTLLVAAAWAGLAVLNPEDYP